MGQFVEELNRRNVIRVGAAYLVVSWVVMQVIDVVVEPLRLPEWTATLVIVLLLIGLPITLFLAWAFEHTPEGVKRTEDLDPEASMPVTGQKLNYVIIGALVLAVAGLLYDRSVPRAPENVSEDTPPEIVATAESIQKSIAVLPFVNMSSDPEQEYFSDGIAEELLNVLAKIDGLKVAARTSSFSFKGQNKPVAEIAEVLGVRHFLEGSVRKSGTQIRITAQLIRVSDGFNMWSETYDRELVNIFAIQDEIAKAIVDELRVRLTDQTQIASASTDNPEAYREYLQGRYFWDLRTTEDLYRAAEHFDRATKLDPTYTDAWLGMAETWVVLPGSELNDAKAPDQLEQARKAARSALSLFPRSGRAHAVLGYAHIVRLEWRESFVNFELALQYEPENATAWQWYGILLAHIGRHEESAAAFEKALELDPLSRIIGTNAADFLAAAGHYNAALEQITRTLSVTPDFEYGLQILGFIHLMRHEFDDARAAIRRQSELIGVDAGRRMAFVDRAEAFAQTGARAELSKFYKEEILFDRDLHTLALACIGQYKAALDMVEQFSGTNYARSSLNFLRSVLFQEAMGDNPRYQELVQRLATFDGGSN